MTHSLLHRSGLCNLHGVEFERCNLHFGANWKTKKTGQTCFEEFEGQKNMTFTFPLFTSEAVQCAKADLNGNMILSFGQLNSRGIDLAL